MRNQSVRVLLPCLAPVAMGIALALSSAVFPAGCLGAQPKGFRPGRLELVAGRPDDPGTLDGTGAAARLDLPMDLAVDAAGTCYLAEDKAIRKVTSAGEVSSLASGRVGDGDVIRPWGVAVARDGNVYASELFGKRILKVTPEGRVTLLAGRPGTTDQVDGQGEDAHFYGPSRLTTDDAGNVYVTDAASVRKITPGGLVTTVLAGPDPRSEQARKPALSALVRDPAGNLYLTEGKTIHKLTPGGVSTLLAGNPDEDGFRDGRGPAARFAGISGLALDAAGNVYAADCRNAAVRKITPAGVVTTVAGRAGRSGVATGPFPEANLCYPSGLAFTPAGDLMVVMGNGLFRITAAR